MIIKLKQEYIDARHDCQRDQDNCPSAMAINEVLMPEFRARVYNFRTDIRRTTGECVKTMLNPEVLKNWISCFDKGAAMAPIEFELPIDDYCIQPDVGFDKAAWIEKFKTQLRLLHYKSIHSRKSGDWKGRPYL